MVPHDETARQTSCRILPPQRGLFRLPLYIPGPESVLVRLQLDGAGPLLTVGTISTLAMAQRGEVLGRYRELTHRLADILIDGIIEGSVRPVDPLLAAEMIVQTVNIAHELPRWVRGADETSAADMLARPLFEGALP